MMNDQNSPCELVLKIGCNEYDEISTAIISLLRSCSINDQKFVSVERQIHPTTYFGSFTTQLSTFKIPIQCQSLSCVIILTDELFQQQEKSEFLKSTHLWNFHHKIELLNEYKQTIARQDYYELSNLLPLWSVSHIPYNKQIIIRFNIFTKKFDLMVKFYENLFQRKPDSSKTGFVLFNFSPMINKKLVYQFSIKCSSSIQSYTISQNAYFKFRLNNLHYFLQEYSTKLFTINKTEYYIYDPDGNLLHLYLHNISSTLKESSKSLIHTNDSGFCDSSSDPSIKLFHSILPQINPDQSHSSNDSGQCSSISSNDLHTIKQKIHHNPIPIVNNISVRTAKQSEMDYRLKQQQRTVFPPVFLKSQECKSSFYDSEPRLSNIRSYDNRDYSSMNNVQKFNKIRSFSTKSSVLKNSNKNISYEIDSQGITNPSSFGYLNAFLLKKQQEQQFNRSQNVKQLISQFEKPLTSRPKSAPLIDQLLTPIKSRSIHETIIPIQNQSSRLRSKSVTSNGQNSNNDISSTTDDEIINNPIDQTRNSRINIGITLDSRLRKPPVLDMLRSTTMESNIIEPKYSLRNSFIPIARF